MSCKGRNWRADSEFASCTSLIFISPRLALDAISKNDKMKNSKKEKDRKEIRIL